MTFDTSQLEKHFGMTNAYEVHTAAAGAPGGVWETRTDDKGIARFKLRVHVEAAPNGQGSVQQETNAFTVTANPYGVKNVFAAILNLLDLGLIQDQGSLTAEWHTGSVQVKTWHGTVTVVWNAAVPNGGSGHTEATFTIPKAPTAVGTYTASASSTLVVHTGTCTTTSTFSGSGSGIQSAAGSLDPDGNLTIIWHTVMVPVAGTVIGTGSSPNCQGSGPITGNVSLEGGEVTVTADPQATSLSNSLAQPGAFTTVSWDLVKD